MRRTILHGNGGADLGLTEEKMGNNAAIWTDTSSI